MCFCIWVCNRYSQLKFYIRLKLHMITVIQYMLISENSVEEDDNEVMMSSIINDLLKIKKKILNLSTCVVSRRKGD